MDFTDSQIESPAKAFTESSAFARYASTVAPVRYPRTIYLYKWLAIFIDGKNTFMVSHRNSTDGWQKAVLHNVVTEFFGIPHDVIEEFSPPLIGKPTIIGGESSDANLRITQILSSTDGDVSNPIDIDLVLNQMIGPARITGSMKQIIDGGMFAAMGDNGEEFWSYKDNISESANGRGGGYDTTADFTGITGELQHVTVDYPTGSTGQNMTGIGYVYDPSDSNHANPHLQPVSYVSFDDLGEILIAQSLAPAPALDCIMIEWILVVDQLTLQSFQFPIVTPVAGQLTPYLIPIPDVKTIWSRAPSFLPFNRMGATRLVRGIANKLYPQYATEAAWRAAGAHF